MSVPYYIEHGKKAYLELPGMEVAKRHRGLDSFRRSIRTDREDTFRDGGAVPGFPHMRLKEVVSKQDGPGWMHELTGEGLRRGPHKLESSSLQQPAEGWDEGPQTWLTVEPSAFQIGLAHPTVPTLWCEGMDSKEDLNGHVWRVTPSYKGIIPDALGNPKPEKWRGTLNGQTVSTGTPISFYGQPWIVDEDNAFNGWVGPYKGEFDASQVTVICSKLSFTPPPTDRVGRHYTPARVPLMDNIYDETGWTSAAGFTYAWPAGWRLSGVQWDQILDKEIYLYTLSWSYVPRIKPNL